MKTFKNSETVEPSGVSVNEKNVYKLKPLKLLNYFASCGYVNMLTAMYVNESKRPQRSNMITIQALKVFF